MSEISLPLQQKRSQRSFGTIRTDKDVLQTILFNEEKRLNYYEKKRRHCKRSYKYINSLDDHKSSTFT